MPDFGFAARLAAAARERGALRFAARAALAPELRFSFLFFFLLFFALRDVDFFACLRAAAFRTAAAPGGDFAAGASTPRS